jgi:uncharacterized protein YrzB (UPF0473 family)
MSTVRQTRQLREVFGDDIILFDEGNESVVYRILAEFQHNGSSYAVLQSDALKKEDEVAIFRVATGEQGEPQLETIEDDDEWETVSELYDEMIFPLKDELD